MMNTSSHWLLSAYSDENERSLARLLRNIVLFSILATLVIAVVSFFNDDPVSAVALTITSGVLVGSLLLLRAGGLRAASWIVPLIALTIISYEVYAVGDGTKEVQILGYPVIILFATLLLGQRGAWIFTLLSAASYTAILFIHKYQLLRPYELAEDLLPLDAVVAAVILAIIAYVQILIVNRLTASLEQLQAQEAELRTTITALEEIQTNLEKMVADRTEQIAVSAEVGRVASASLNPNEVIHQAVNLITERFGYYYAAIFLVDDTGLWANLVDATGDAGRALLERSHRLQIGGRSMVGSAITTRQAKIALDAGAEPVRFENPLLPKTRSEIALPLIAGQQVLGALDVQSVEGNAFREEDVEVLQALANQVAVAIENARLYQDAQARLEEVQRLYRRDFQAPARGVRYEGGEISFITTDETEPVAKVTDLQVEEDGQITRVLAPLRAGDKVIGVLHLQSRDRPWTEQDLDLLNTAVNQVSATIENALLVQETEARARQERMLSEGTARIRETLDMETILQSAADEIRRTLNLMEVEVHIGTTPQAPPSPTNGQ